MEKALPDILVLSVSLSALLRVSFAVVLGGLRWRKKEKNLFFLSSTQLQESGLKMNLDFYLEHKNTLNNLPLT